MTVTHLGRDVDDLQAEDGKEVRDELIRRFWVREVELRKVVVRSERDLRQARHAPRYTRLPHSP